MLDNYRYRCCVLNLGFAHGIPRLASVVIKGGIFRWRSRGTVSVRLGRLSVIAEFVIRRVAQSQRGRLIVKG